MLLFRLVSQGISGVSNDNKDDLSMKIFFSAAKEKKSKLLPHSKEHVANDRSKKDAACRNNFVTTYSLHEGKGFLFR